MPYCIYLRKSRADIEAEALGAGDTLKRHESTLTALALRQGLSVEQIYREVVSGDTISARPQMRRLLADVERRRWDGVLCMEVERLARGDTIDQGVVAQTFKYSGTVIITPQKLYDPSDAMDEEYFEFSLFMARREYNAIKRRLMAGRAASAREGNYLAPKPTYGYFRVRAPGRGTRWRLVVNPGEAAVVRSIFDWYERGVDGRAASPQAICERLNSMGLRTAEGRPFYPSGIRAILHNMTYTGALTWNKRVKRTAMAGGARVTRRELNREPVIAYGAHEPIISCEQFARVQRIFAERSASSARPDRAPRNPLRGLIVCGECGGRMQLKRDARRARAEALRCTTPGCPTCPAPLAAVESALLDALGALPALAAPCSAPQRPELGYAPGGAESGLRLALSRQAEQLRRQRERISELLETGVYDAEEYAARSAQIDARLAALRAALSAAPHPQAGEPARIGAPCSLPREYARAASPEVKRALMASVIDHVIYRRSKRARRGAGPALGMSLEIYLKDL